MAARVRWYPFPEFENLERIMDRMVDEAFQSGRMDLDQTDRWELPVDAFENNDEYVVKASLPGVQPENINITYNNGTLMIQAEAREDEEKDQRFLLRERRFGTFTRSISLPAVVDASKIDASYDAGILTLRLPKTEEVKPKRIPIQSQQKMIEAQVHNGKNNK
jgi:HSP20 family protein